MELTQRERLRRLFKGEHVDRVPFVNPMGFWGSCLDRWKKEGLNKEATYETVKEIIGVDGELWFGLPVSFFVWPEYERKVVGEYNGKALMQNCWGGKEINQDNSELLPVTVSGPVKDRQSWEEIKGRLISESPGRLPNNWRDIVKQAEESNLPVCAGDLPVGFFGGARELMGLENQAYLFYDDPRLMHEVLDTFCDLWIGVYIEIQKSIDIDLFFIWEDMCYKNGPLLNPKLFEEFLLPCYKRLTKAIRDKGCDNIMVDSDGDIRPLIPLWTEGGVNILYPWETQFGLDIAGVRRLYPKLGMIGGINKKVLSMGKEAIDEELKKVPFMIESGRYIPALDHNVTPEVSWDNFKYFFYRLRELVFKYQPVPD